MTVRKGKGVRGPPLISNTKIQSKKGFITCRSVFYESYSTLNGCSERKGCKRSPSLILSQTFYFQQTLVSTHYHTGAVEVAQNIVSGNDIFIEIVPSCSG